MKFVIGVLSGVTLGMIFAPAKGKETREQLTHRASDLAEMPRRKAQNAVDAGREKVGEVAKQQAEDVYTNAVDKVSGGRLR
ncbi:MAG TPA: YtxH domain-containing protein [Terriglobales bacterium]|nr:YtxH domain-containing protein [Terriglobales bacterium]